MGEEQDDLDTNEANTDEFIIRPYQTEILEIAVKQNTIVFLPTGSGKTFIAVMLINRLAHQIIKPNNKVTFLLVNTVPLIEQHCLTLKRHTDFVTGHFSGDMNVDYWSKEQWTEQLSKYQVVVLTAQIFLDIIRHRYFKLEDANLLIFDECHQAVNDQPMRQIMQTFENVEDRNNLPRVLGLTATLLNGNCAAHKVIDQVLSLETTFHSKVATVGNFAQVLGFSANPQEKLISYKSPAKSEVIDEALYHLKNLLNFLNEFQLPAQCGESEIKNILNGTQDKSIKPYRKMVTSLILHINMVGIYGGSKAALACIIKMERYNRHPKDEYLEWIFETMITTFTLVKKILEDSMIGFPASTQIFKFSSPKVLMLIEILRNYKDTSICGLIFVQERFTSKVLYYILKDLALHDPEFSFIRCNFMYGFNAGTSERDTRETYYAAKINKKIVSEFRCNDINLLIASNVIEEGIDIPTCTLVVKFDKPMDYRSYIQSKGRARHNTSSYIIMVAAEEKAAYMSKYTGFNEIEGVLKKYLVGQTDNRQLPSDEKIQKELYEDHDVPPYYAKGPNSAHVTGVGSISLLNRYCQQLLRDRYAQLAPTWYIESASKDDTQLVVVVIEMPISCPLRGEIRGLPMSNRLSAKRSAAIEVIKQLHKIGEFNDKLFPRTETEDEVSFEHFFKHWPTEEKNLANEVDDSDIKIKAKPGTKRFIREHQLINPPFILPEENLASNEYYIYPINMESTTTGHILNTINKEIIDSNLGYALLTRSKLPLICQFPVYLSAGEIKITLGTYYKINLNDTELKSVKKFNYFIYYDVLQVLQHFLIFDCAETSEFLLIVPIIKEINQKPYIAMDIMTENTELISVQEPSLQDKINLQVSTETHLKKIVCPWYRSHESVYMVIGICEDLNALSPFPSTDFKNYQSYYKTKYDQQICAPKLPLLLVKGIRKKINCILPRSATIHNTGKRNRDAFKDCLEEHLLPELCVVQKYPGELWYLAYCLPTIVHRVTILMRAEYLRRIIAEETGFGDVFSTESQPLTIDERTLHPEPKKIEPIPERNVNVSEESVQALMPVSQPERLTNKDYAAKMLERQYSWKDEEEPVDLERHMDNITILDIEIYEQFMNKKYTYEDARKIISPSKVASKFPALTLEYEYEEKPIKMLEKEDGRQAPDQALIFQSLTTIKANEIVNLERLETLGDSFLKFITTLYLFLEYPNYGEGRLTYVKGKIIGNKNLLYCAIKKNLGGFMNISDFAPTTDWLPPTLRVPNLICELIKSKKVTPCSLFSFGFSIEEQLDGNLNDDTVTDILNIAEDLSKEEAIQTESITCLNKYLGKQNIQDKNVSDCVEALIGAYLLKCGIQGALAIVRWFGILPLKQEEININGIFTRAPESPIINPNTKLEDIDNHIPNYAKLEEHLGYKFKNRAYLLQAVTHASFCINRVTDCYQRLEFLGDAVLDFLITCHIYEIAGNLTPGELTDYRSALVNNVTFACLVVRNGFHKYLKFINPKLMDAIDTFVKFQEMRDHVINEELLILVEEHPLYMAEYVDVPKVLGDLFESLAAAIFLDTGMDVQKTWKVIHALMWNEIEMFRRNVPKNPVRLLYETTNAAPKFLDSTIVQNSVTCVTCSIMVNGRKHCVHGFGDNKKQAKLAAAKLALRLLKC